jgi:ubiquinone biosynthesis protein
MAHILSAIGLERLVPLELRAHGGAPLEEAYSEPVNVRLMLEELGPTFVKLGQILSTRADLLSPPYRAELAKLRDAAPHLSRSAVQAVLAEELSPSWESRFARFDFEPVAAASIGQAHTAVLLDGTEVVVKVRRPGATEQVELDLEIIRELAVHARQRWGEAARLDIVGLVEEFATALRAELDYLHEARSARRFATNFAGNEQVRVPRIYAEFTTSRVITLDRIAGVKIGDAAALDAAGIDRRAVAGNFARLVGEMVFEHGYFHADPHGGNFFVDTAGAIGVIDFGRMGALDYQLRQHTAALFSAFGRRDADQLAAVLDTLGASRSGTDHVRLRADLARLLERCGGRGVEDIDIGAAIGEVFDIARNDYLVLPRDLALLLTMLLMAEGLISDIDPDLHFDEVLTPFALRGVDSELSPAALARRAERFVMEIARVAADLPDQLHHALEALASGGFDLRLRAEDIELVVSAAERLADRVAGAVLLASAIDALSSLAAADRMLGVSHHKAVRGIRLAVVGSVVAYSVWRRSGLPKLRKARAQPRAVSQPVAGCPGAPFVN